MKVLKISRASIRVMGVVYNANLHQLSCALASCIVIDDVPWWQVSGLRVSKKIRLGALTRARRLIWLTTRTSLVPYWGGMKEWLSLLLAIGLPFLYYWIIQAPHRHNSFRSACTRFEKRKLLSGVYLALLLVFRATRLYWNPFLCPIYALWHCKFGFSAVPWLL